MNDSFLLFKNQTVVFIFVEWKQAWQPFQMRSPLFSLVWIVYMETKDDLHKKKSLWNVTITRTEDGRFLSAQLISSLTVVYDVSVLVQFDPH